MKRITLQDVRAMLFAVRMLAGPQVLAQAIEATTPCGDKVLLQPNRR